MPQRQLVLFRHAHADPRVVDFERELSARGRGQPGPAAAALRAAGFAPGQVLCSASVRTRSTLALLDEAGLLGAAPVEFSRDIYECTVARLMSAISATDDAVDALLVIGHNPGLADLASALCSGTLGLSPGGYARLGLLDRWGAFGATRARLLEHRNP